MASTLTTGRTLGLLLTCWWLGLVRTTDEVKVSSWCYSADEPSKTISCDDKDSTIVVVRAFAGISQRPVQDFCEFPRPAPGDCILSEAAKTDDFRRECNTFNTCTFMVWNAPSNSCGGTYTGNMYLFLEYKCQTLYDEMGQHNPIVEGCAAGALRQEESSLTLYNVGYPTTSRPMEHCRLTMWTSNGAKVVVTIRDLAHDEVDNLACPFHLTFSDGVPQCAKRGMTYRSIAVLSGSSMEFVTNTSQVFGRYWIHISPIDPSGSLTIQFTSSSTQQVSTSVPSLEETTQGKPTTQTSTILPTTTTTQNPTTSTTGPKSTTTAASTQATNQVTGSVANGTDTNLTHLQPGGSTDMPTASLGEEMTSVGGGPSIKADMSMGIKIIIGGAVAGTLIVVIIVACVAICVRRKKKPTQKRRRDLGYSVHANLAIASKLGVKSGDLRNPSRGASKKKLNHPYVNSPPLQQPFDNNTLNSSENSYSNLGPVPRNVVVRMSSAKPAYENEDRKSKRKSQHRRSASQTTLTTSIETSGESLDRGGRLQYGATNDVFAAFPRWEDNPRYSGASDQFDQHTSTLPAKLNKKPMPLPKPKRSPSSASVQQRPTPGTSNSISSLDQFGTTSSTTALYAVPNKKRKSKDFPAGEAQIYVNSRRF